eukprot:XP_016657857.1 PREDICTED: uncharacterized protein LOC100568525 [Acyrthosiphon pisum]
MTEMDDSRKRLLLLTTKIPSDVLFALSLPIFFTRHPQHDRGNAALKMSVKLKQQGEDITYLEFCKLFVDIYQDQNVLNICKEIYSSQTGGGNNESIALNDIEQKVKDMMQLSVEGMPSTFDCDGEIDAMPPSASNDFSDDFAMIDNNDSDSWIVTVMPDEFVTVKSKITTEPTQPDTTVSQWNVVTPQHLKSKVSTPLRTPFRKKKTRTAEATNSLQHKDQLVTLQMKCLEQEVVINEVRKRNMLLEETKLKLEIQLLQKQLQM